MSLRGLLRILPLLLCAAAASVVADDAPRAVTNLLSNGSFEKPIQWGRDWFTEQKPLLKTVGNANHGAKCMHMTVPAKEAAVEGVAFKSEFVPCVPGGTYRVAYDLKGTGCTVIVFVEAYDPKFIDRPQGDYRKQCDRVGAPRQWKSYEHYFRIRRSPKSIANISKMQVKVFAFYPEGEVWVDNVVLHPVSDEEFEKNK
jgi:hypothetical protein